MPSYTAVRTIDKSRPDGGLVTKLESGIAQYLSTKFPSQYEIVAPTKIQVTAPQAQTTEAKPCVGCGK